MATPLGALESRAQPRLSTARKRTPILPSAVPALPSSKSSRLSSARTARHGSGAPRGTPRDPETYEMGYPVQASPVLLEDQDGMGALRRVAENLFTTIILQSFLRWKGEHFCLAPLLLASSWALGQA